MPKGKLFDTVARLQPSLVEFEHPLDQCLKTRRHLRFLPLVLDVRRKKVLVRPLGHVMYVNMKPFLGGTFPATLECSIQVIPRQLQRSVSPMSEKTLRL
jgi:hypothetical protein